MKIQSVHIRNYRKLKNCHIDFDEKKTVLVGANNSGKTSAISAIVWFLKNTDRFTLKEFTATNWAAINEIGEKWLEHDSVDEALLDSHQWDNIVPSMDVWINVEDGEQYRQRPCGRCQVDQSQPRRLRAGGRRAQNSRIGVC